VSLRARLQAKEIPQEAYAEGQTPYSHAPVITSAEARVDWAVMSAADIARVHRAIGHQVRPLVQNADALLIPHP
jgi:methionyl-tRNA formyltransferase